MTEDREDREHITTGLDCWCGPRVDFYGAEEALGGDEQQTAPQDGEE